MDKTDRKILYALDTNCRQSNAKIAKQLKISKDIVNYRIKKLEEKSIIEGYRTVINTCKLGYWTFRIYLKLQNTTKEIEQKITHDLKNDNDIWWLGRNSGWNDIVFAFWTKSHRKFYNFWISFLKKYRRYIQEEKVSTFVEYVLFRRTYLLGKGDDKKTSDIIFIGEPIKYDKIDWKILALLAGNARMPLLEIAQKIKLTPMAAKHRIKNLEKKGVIQGYKPIINFGKFGYNYYKVDMVLEDVSKIKAMQTYCEMHPHIVYIDRTIGGSDLEFDLEVKSLAHFLEIMESFTEKFKDAIRNYQYFALYKVHKVLYFPVKFES